MSQDNKYARIRLDLRVTGRTQLAQVIRKIRRQSYDQVCSRNGRSFMIIVVGSGLAAYTFVQELRRHSKKFQLPWLPRIAVAIT